MARVARTHIMRWAPQDMRDSRVRIRSIRTVDPWLRLVYMEILFQLHLQGGSLTCDPELLQDDLGVPVDEVVRCLPILEDMGREGSGGIQIREGRIYNRRVTEDLEAELEYRVTQREHGRSGGALAGKGRPSRPATDDRATPIDSEWTPNPPSPAPAPYPAPAPAPAPAPDAEGAAAAADPSEPGGEGSRGEGAPPGDWPPGVQSIRAAGRRALHAAELELLRTELGQLAARAVAAGAASLEAVFLDASRIPDTGAAWSDPAACTSAPWARATLDRLRAADRDLARDRLALGLPWPPRPPPVSQASEASP